MFTRPGREACLIPVCWSYLKSEENMSGTWSWNSFKGNLDLGVDRAWISSRRSWWGLQCLVSFEGSSGLRSQSGYHWGIARRRGSNREWICTSTANHWNCSLDFFPGSSRNYWPKGHAAKFPSWNDVIYGMPDQSPITRLMAVRPPTIKIAPTQASPSSSNEELDYSRSDIDWDNVRPALDSNNFSYLAVKEMGVIFVEGNIWLHCTFFYSLYRYVSDIFLSWYSFRNSSGRFW